MRRFRGWWAAAVVSVAFGAGCGDDKGKDEPKGDAQGDGAEGDSEEDPWAAPAESSDFRIIYGNRGRLPTNMNENDLWLMDADGKNQRALTQFGQLEELDPPLSCNYGCFVSPNLQWLAVVTGAPGDRGFTLRLGRFNANLEVSLLKGGTLDNIIDFHFAGDRIFYSQLDTCNGASCSYTFSLIELSENVNVPRPFMTFPTGADLEGSTFRGRFRASPDGKRLALLNTTIRSVDVFLWREGTGLVELEFLCKFGTKSDCVGAGSEYVDTDPLAFSADSRMLVFFSFADRWQKIYLYDTDNPGTKWSAVAAEVASGAYIENACNPGVLKDWQWQRVLGDPWFTPNGDEVVFLGEQACPVDGRAPVKPASNLYRVKVATIQSGKTLTEADVFPVTRHPAGDVTANRRPTSFAGTADGATLIFSGTPSYDQNGALIPDGNARQRNDREIYRIRLDGTNAQQLTNDLPFATETPMVVPR